MGGSGPQIDGAEAMSALEWWLESGVDVLVDERPRNWLEEKQTPSHQSESEPGSASPDEAGVPDSLPLFREWLASASTGAKGKSKPVLPQGEEGAEVMLIAEAPGREEAVAGTPIAGEAATLMERMLAAIGWNRSQAYFANLSCFYAPGAKPAAKDLQECAEAARTHIALAKPKRLLLLGDAPARALLGKSLAEARGHLHRVEGIRTIVTFHPRFLLDRPSDKARAWKDLLLLMDDDE
jgi:DNA polymerase